MRQCHTLSLPIMSNNSKCQFDYVSTNYMYSNLFSEEDVWYDKSICNDTQAKAIS